MVALKYGLDGLSSVAHEAYAYLALKTHVLEVQPALFWWSAEQGRSENDAQVGHGHLVHGLFLSYPAWSDCSGKALTCQDAP